MAALTIENEVKFPNGTEVGAYPKSNWPVPGEPSGEPIGEATEEATVEEGKAKFTELEANTEYWLVAEVGESWVYVGIFTAQGDEVTGARDEPEKALKNLLTVLDEKGSITDATTES